MSLAMSLTDSISFATSVGTFFGVIVAGYIGIRQLKLIATQVNNEYEWRKRRNALDYSLTRSEQHRSARLNLEKTFGLFTKIDDALATSKIDAAIEKDPSVATDIRVLLGHWENMALSIHAKISDEDVCYEMVGGSVIQAVRLFRNYIERARDTTPDIYKYLIPLSAHWSERKRGKPVKDFVDLAIA